MSDNPGKLFDGNPTLAGKRTTRRSHGPYAQLCDLRVLQRAYREIKEDPGQWKIRPGDLQTIEAEGVEGFLKRVQGQLQARSYRPAHASQGSSAKQKTEDPNTLRIRDQVVQAALGLVLQPLFEPDSQPDLDQQRPQPTAEETANLIAKAIERGLTRVFAVNLDHCFGAVAHDLLLEKIGHRVHDADLINLLKAVL